MTVTVYRDTNCVLSLFLQVSLISSLFLSLPRQLSLITCGNDTFKDLKMYGGCIGNRPKVIRECQESRSRHRQWGQCIKCIMLPGNSYSYNRVVFPHLSSPLPFHLLLLPTDVQSCQKIHCVRTKTVSQQRHGTALYSGCSLCLDVKEPQSNGLLFGDPLGEKALQMPRSV